MLLSAGRRTRRASSELRDAYVYGSLRVKEIEEYSVLCIRLRIASELH